MRVGIKMILMAVAIVLLLVSYSSAQDDPMSNRQVDRQQRESTVVKINQMIGQHYIDHNLAFEVVQELANQE